MLNAILGAGSGILTGLLGTGMQALFKWLGDRQRFAHDLAMRRIDIEAMQTEHTLRLKETEAQFAGQEKIARVDLEKAEAIAGAEIRAASYANDRASYYDRGMTGWVAAVMAIVDAFRGFMRPGITAYLLIVTSVIAFGLHQTLEGAIAQNPVDLYKQVIMSVLFLTETAVTWWFGSRALARKAA
jgi:hypothetical protein